TRDQRLHPRLLQTHQHQGVTRRSLYQGNLSLVLVATVRGARGSHVRLISGLAAPRERRRRPDDQHIFIRRGWPTTAMGGLSAIGAHRYATLRFRRSLATVRGEIMRSWRLVPS